MVVGQKSLFCVVSWWPGQWASLKVVKHELGRDHHGFPGYQAQLKLGNGIDRETSNSHILASGPLYRT